MQIVESGVGDKSRFVGNPNYVITDVPDSEIEKLNMNLNRLTYNPADKTISQKPTAELRKIARVSNKEKIVSLRTELSSLQSLRSVESDAETQVILDERIKKISDSIAELEALNDGLR